MQYILHAINIDPSVRLAMDSPQSISNDVEGLSVPLDLGQVYLLKIVPGADDEPVSCLLLTIVTKRCILSSIWVSVGVKHSRIDRGC
jgi:hypothetical protein